MCNLRLKYTPETLHYSYTPTSGVFTLMTGIFSLGLHERTEERPSTPVSVFSRHTSVVLYGRRLESEDRSLDVLYLKVPSIRHIGDREVISSGMTNWVGLRKYYIS